MRSLVSLNVLAAVSFATYASADSGSPDNIPGISGTNPGITPEGALAPVSIVEGPGLKVGEGTVLHPILGVETGFVSNVFFEDGAETPVSAGILRLLAQVGAGSLSPQRLATNGETDAPTEQANVGTLQYRADLRLTYDLFLSGDEEVQDQGGLGVGALFRGVVFPKRTWSFLYLDNYQRIIRATNFESTEHTNRNINRLSLGLQFAPGGRAITGLLHYDNVLDFFEDEDQQFANRLQHAIGLTVSWRFRPYTVFFADVTQGIYGGLGDSIKVPSYPLTVAVGAQTLLGVNSSIITRIGYTNGFYSAGPSYSAVVGGVQFGYRYAHTGRVTLLYDYNHQDSINANYFRDHRIAATIEQQLVPVIFHAGPELRLRRYHGVQQVVPTAPSDTRDDFILSVGAGVRYNFRDWFAGVVEYRLSLLETDFMYSVDGASDNPSFSRHELVAGIRAAL